MTRYEQIKNMTVEEMAKQFDDTGFMTDKICHEMDRCPYITADGDISDDCDCTGCIEKWLKSEVDKNE
jgi:hypothetical protein